MSRSIAVSMFARAALAGLAVAAFGARADSGLPPMDCVIEPNEVVDLSSAVDGVVREMLADRGDFVEEGQVVVRLDSGVEDAALAYAKARAAANAQLQAEQVSAEFARRRKERLETLFKQQALASDQMDEVATDARLKQLQLKQAAEARRLAMLDMRQAEEVAKRHIIRSPVRGVVVRRFLSPGESVENKAIMRIAQIDPLRAEVIIPVAHFGAVKVGQKAVVVPEAPRNEPHPATVTVVDRVADAASGTFRATVTLPNPDYSLPSGLRCSVRFQDAGQLASGDLPPPPAPRPGSNAPVLLAPGAVPMASTKPAVPPAKAASPSAATSRLSAALAPGPGIGPPRRLGPAKTSRDSRLARADARPKDDRQGLTSASSPTTERICQVLGPLADGGKADKIRDRLARVADEVAVRVEGADDGSASRYLVLSAPPASAEAGRELLGELRSAGLSDVALLSRGPHAGRVSAGVYSGPQTAERRREFLGTRGFDFEIVARGGKASEYWVDVRSSADLDRQLGLLAAVRELAPPVALAVVDCDPRILAARN